MRFGHFDDAAKEYVVDRPDTPKSWTNYLGTTEYGSVITNNAGGYSFYKSASQGRFMRFRTNTIPMDQPGRYFYIRDNADGDYWSSSWQPVGKPLERYRSECRHGTAYTIITSQYAGIRSESTYFVPLQQTFEYWRLRVTNESGRPRDLSVFTFAEFACNWRLTQDLINQQYTAYIVRAEWKDGILGIITNPNVPPDPEHFENGDQGRSIWMTLTGADIAGYESDRERFLGSYRTYANPIVVERGQCGGSLAYGDNPCGCVQANLMLAPGETRELVVLLGVGWAAEEGRRAVAKFASPTRVEKELQAVKKEWHSKLESLKVETPDKDLDHMVNVWNPYACLINFAWSRAASLVYSGERDGLGYRDTVQDFVGSAALIPEETRQRLELMITGQLSHGGAMEVVKQFSHHPGHEKGPDDHSRLRADDCLWLFNAVPAYVNETGDSGFYRKVLPYADKGEDTVFKHLRRALEFNLNHTGAHGLPSGLHADWNDCIRLGEKGESLFVTLQARLGFKVYGEIAEMLGEKAEAAWARTQLAAMDEKIQKYGWDGEWFVRAYKDDGEVMGSKTCKEGRIFLNPQTWAVLSGAATPEQAVKAMDSAYLQLFTDYGLMLCRPAFKDTPYHVVRAVLFNEGTKENGGIFSQIQPWAVMAECVLGRGERAMEYYRAFLPAAQNDKAEIRQIEPYVFCQSTHSRASRQYGVSRLPWLTGTTAWAYYAATHHILGLQPEADGMRIDPCIPSAWKSFSMERRFRGKTLSIRVENPNGVQKGVRRLTLNGKEMKGGFIPAKELKAKNDITVVMG